MLLSIFQKKPPQNSHHEQKDWNLQILIVECDLGWKRDDPKAGMGFQESKAQTVYRNEMGLWHQKSRGGTHSVSVAEIETAVITDILQIALESYSELSLCRIPRTRLPKSLR